MSLQKYEKNTKSAVLDQKDVALRCLEVELKVGHRTLLRGINITVNAGESLALTGPNGLGKTTLLRCLAGISRPHCGQVTVCREELWPTRLVTNEHTAVFLASQPALLGDHTVAGNLEFMCNSFAYKPSFSEINLALDQVGLEGRQFQISRTLSTGQKRRLTLAFALILKPKVLIADEPTNGLDMQGVQLCQHIFLSLMKEHKMALLTATHDERLIDWCTHNIPLEGFIPTQRQKHSDIIGSVFQ